MRIIAVVVTPGNMSGNMPARLCGSLVLQYSCVSANKDFCLVILPYNGRHE
jgi:hypothetical protein